MNIARFTFNPIAENTYVAWDETGEAVIIDAGNNTRQENEALANFLKDKELMLVAVLATHCHFDHVLGVKWLVETYKIPFVAHSADSFLLDAEAGRFFGVSVGEMPHIDVDLAYSQHFTFGNSSLRVIPTPGHTPGHVCFFDSAGRTLFSGDTLFADSIGRTDLPGGDYSWIMRSILDNLLPLGGDVRVYPGHGRDTTLGHEAANNPFIVEVLNHDVNY